MTVQAHMPPLSQQQPMLRNGEVTCRRLVEQHLARIHADNPRLNCFREVFEAEALAQADRIDQRIQAGTAGRLAGLVTGIKDNICYRQHRVEASSKILEGFESLFSATAVDRLLAEDAIIIGRLNCDEFAMGSSNENSAYGPVLNPLDENRVPGGSSGGSAAAVAAGMCQVALGSDTGGSIRQPAAFCGTIGLKPTYGRVSRYGLIAFGSSFDQIGPIAHHPSDTAAVLEVIAGRDNHDGTAASTPVPAYTERMAEKAGQPYQLAFLRDCFAPENLDAEVREGLHRVIDSVIDKGFASKADADLAYLNQMIPTYQILSNAEASSNLSRYDGILFGYRSPEAQDLSDTILKSRTEGFGTEVKRRIMLGTFVLSEGYYDAYYNKAQKLRNLVKQGIDDLLAENDFLVLPATPSTAFSFGDKENLTAMYNEDIFTIPASLGGFPAITVPVGTHSNGLPYSIQLIGRHFEEDRLLAFTEKLVQTVG